MFRSKILTFLFVLFLLATAQAQNPRGSLRGAVQDATGARLPNAKVVLESAGSSLRREAASEDRGEFRIDDLLPGNYRVTVSAPNFAPARSEVSVQVSSVREITVTLKPAAPSESVSVQGLSLIHISEPTRPY